MTTDTLVLIKLLGIVALLAWFGYSQLRSVRGDDAGRSKPDPPEDAKPPDRGD